MGDEDREAWARAIEAKLPEDDEDIKELSASDAARLEREETRAKVKKMRAAKGKVIHLASSKPVIREAAKKDA